jgi:hypothetical protein
MFSPFGLVLDGRQTKKNAEPNRNGLILSLFLGKKLVNQRIVV